MEQILETQDRLAGDFATLAERMQRSTVQVRGSGPGGGSGVIWAADGLIITNAHVARGHHATVELTDGRVLQAEVTASDPRRDLAALRVEATSLPAAPIGDSAALRVGELVLAVGHPFGLIGALTAGIVHTIGQASGPGGRQTWVQADVRLAPGNSGGPLANARGQVIGINSMIAGGLALAVPSNAVARFLHAGSQKPYLGVTTRPVLISVAGSQVLGLLILEVARGSPAHGAGLLTGDVVIGAAGSRFGDPDDLPDALQATNPGQSLRLEGSRGGIPRTWEVTVGNATPSVEARGSVTRVLIAAPSAVVRAGLEALVSSSPAVLVVGQTSGPAGLSQRVDELAPDVVLLELEPHEDDPTPTLRALATGSHVPAVVILADLATGSWAAEALRSGVRAVLPRQATALEIIAAVQGAAAGLVVLHPDAAAALLPLLPSPARGLPARLSEALTPREVEVLGMLAEGLGNKTVARRMGISEHTVKFHVGSILTKLNASSRTEAVTLGARQGLIML